MERLIDRRADLQDMGVRYLAVFGSVARDQARPGSDVDILIDLEPPAGLLKHAHVEHYLEALLERDVDLVPRVSVRPEFESRLETEAVRVI